MTDQHEKQREMEEWQKKAERGENQEEEKKKKDEKLILSVTSHGPFDAERALNGDERSREHMKDLL